MYLPCRGITNQCHLATMINHATVLVGEIQE